MWLLGCRDKNLWRNLMWAPGRGFGRELTRGSFGIGILLNLWESWRIQTRIKIVVDSSYPSCLAVSSFSPHRFLSFPWADTLRPRPVLNSHQTLLSSRPLSLILISRRSRHKAGTRYFSRGINEHGHVSNFNETEQLLLLNNHHPTTSSSSAIPPIVGSGYGSLVDGGGIGDIRFSFVQTRGSVPIYWAEINNLRYKPDLKILELSGSVGPFSLIFLPLYYTDIPSLLSITARKFKTSSGFSSQWIRNSIPNQSSKPKRLRTSHQERFWKRFTRLYGR